MADRCLQHLQRDHREGERVLARMEALLAACGREPQWDTARRESFASIVSFFEDVAIAHIGKEEQVLFPALEAYLPGEVGPLAVLRAEHRQLDEQFRRWCEVGGLLAFGKQEVRLEKEFQSVGWAMVQLVRDHDYKEDRILFPMVARFLSPEQDDALLRAMEALGPETSSGGRSHLRGQKEGVMGFTRQDLIDRLKLEIEVIERGGYYPSVREPRKLPRIFRDSVSCLNMGLEEKVEPCAHCFLMEFVPQEFAGAEEPCAYIPLNERGDTVAALDAQGRHEEAQELLLAWLRNRVAMLESELPVT